MMHALAAVPPKHKGQVHARPADLLDAIAWVLMPMVCFVIMYAAWRIFARLAGFRRNNNHKERD